MIREEHLEVFELQLTTKAPLFIGSGRSYNKKEYILWEDKRYGEKAVGIIDRTALFSFLVERELYDAYEGFIMSEGRTLDKFLAGDCRLDKNAIRRLCLYTMDAGDALYIDRSLKEIHAFVRDSQNRAYIPGSSVKGALRTALLTHMILQEGAREGTGQLREKSFPEGRYLHTLGLKRNRDGRIADDAVNSLLRGLYVSDSCPIDNKSMILAGKTDADVYGEVHRINLCRECIKPGTSIRFKLTMDRSVLKNDLTVQVLREAISSFSRFYEDEWLTAFKAPRGCADISFENSLLLGGGAGFTTKTLVYPYLGKEAGLDMVAEILASKFKKHHHERDAYEAGISPRVAKYAEFGGRLYPYGLCEVKIH